MEKSSILQISNVEYGYKKNRKILNKISFNAYSGEIIGILGENGSGKSTLLKLLVGLLKPQKGTIQYAGKVGYCPQDIQLFDHLTVAEHFKLFGVGQNYNNQTILEKQAYFLDKLKFEKYKDELVFNLSGGTKQKLNLSLALFADPDILLLDEPYQGFDYETFTKFWDLQKDLRSQNKTILIVSHIIEDRTKLDRIITLRNGYSTYCEPECQCSSCIGESQPPCGSDCTCASCRDERMNISVPEIMN